MPRYAYRAARADGSTLDGRVAVNDRMIAYVEPQPDYDSEPSHIVVVADDGTPIDAIDVKLIRGDVTPLDLSRRVTTSSTRRAMGS